MIFTLSAMIGALVVGVVAGLVVFGVYAQAWTESRNAIEAEINERYKKRFDLITEGYAAAAAIEKERADKYERAFDESLQREEALYAREEFVLCFLAAAKYDHATGLYAVRVVDLGYLITHLRHPRNKLTEAIEILQREGRIPPFLDPKQ